MRFNETQTFDGQPGGGVSAFALDGRAGNLTLLNAQPTYGDFPCHLCVDPTGRYVISANYGSGNYAVPSHGPDGALGAATDVVQHTGRARTRGRRGRTRTWRPSIPRAASCCSLISALTKTLVYRLGTPARAN